MSDAPPNKNEILRIIAPRFEEPALAHAWFEERPLPGFSGATAAQLVAAGRGQEVLDYIAAVDAGVHT